MSNISWSGLKNWVAITRKLPLCFLTEQISPSFSPSPLIKNPFLCFCSGELLDLPWTVRNEWFSSFFSQSAMATEFCKQSRLWFSKKQLVFLCAFVLLGCHILVLGVALTAESIVMSLIQTLYRLISCSSPVIWLLCLQIGATIGSNSTCYEKWACFTNCAKTEGIKANNLIVCAVIYIFFHCITNLKCTQRVQTSAKKLIIYNNAFFDRSTQTEVNEC